MSYLLSYLFSKKIPEEIKNDVEYGTVTEETVDEKRGIVGEKRESEEQEIVGEKRESEEQEIVGEKRESEEKEIVHEERDGYITIENETEQLAVIQPFVPIEQYMNKVNELVVEKVNEIVVELDIKEVTVNEIVVEKVNEIVVEKVNEIVVEKVNEIVVEPIHCIQDVKVIPNEPVPDLETQISQSIDDPDLELTPYPYQFEWNPTNDELDSIIDLKDIDFTKMVLDSIKELLEEL